MVYLPLSKRSPGKLAKSTILNGFSALKTLSEVINSPTGALATQHGGFRKAVEDLTSRYHSYASLSLHLLELSH